MRSVRRLGGAAVRARGSFAGARRALGDDAAATKSWAPSSLENLKKTTTKALVHELTQQQVRAAETIVPWFLDNMPRMYFEQLNEETRLQHLKALSALTGSGSEMSLTVNSVDSHGNRTITYIRPNDEPGLLHKIVQDFPIMEQLQNVKVYTSLDSKICLNVFEFFADADAEGQGVSQVQPELRESLQQYAAAVQAGEHAGDRQHVAAGPYLEPDRLQAFVASCKPSFVNRTSPRRFCQLLRLYDCVAGSEGVEVEVEPLDQTSEEDKDIANGVRLSIALTNVVPRAVLLSITKLLTQNEFNILRLRMDNVAAGAGGEVTLLRFILTGAEGAFEAGTWETLAREIKRIKWLDDHVLSMLERHPSLGLARAEVISALCGLVQGGLYKESAWAFSRTNIRQIVDMPQYLKHATAVADLFIRKFDPSATAADRHAVTAECDVLMAQIKRDVGESADVAAYRLLEKLVQCVTATYRTNLFLESRYALSMRIDPGLLVAPGEDRVLPLGVFFVHGRRFNAFHVRFRDIARGGMRLVTPSSMEQLAIESARHYDEVYGLAFAQQLKNKDIPEGGSKAVVLVDSPNLPAETKAFAMRKSVKAFTDSILDLILYSDDQVVDYWGRPELLYLGPDEQVLPEDIAWIIERAAQRGLKTPTAFMSSKADTGINHKEFGVTSEGVVVFLDVALRNCGIDPKTQAFTVKLTGGPDGDVAGNCIKILDRDFPNTARIVGLADGSGYAEDPAGLCMAELLRLVDASLPITHFDAALLGSDGVVQAADTEENARLRNTMHNRVKSDAFIPAGGRPETINSANWQQFLDEEGRPSSAIVVEGANLFTTPEARQLLWDAAQVQIVKDSSANKCGVICSSYEIIASFLTSESEFRTIKTELVRDVLVQLRQFARLEAQMLYSEFNQFPGSLPESSVRISHAMNRLADAVATELETLPDEQMQALMPLFHQHIPAILRANQDRIAEQVPAAYVKNAIATCLASRIVYNEGTRFVDMLPDQALAATALKYHSAKKGVDELVGTVAGMEGLAEADRSRIVELLKVGGARTMIHHGLSSP